MDKITFNVYWMNEANISSGCGFECARIYRLYICNNIYNDAAIMLQYIIVN